MSTDVVVWIAALVTLAVYSTLYGQNPVSRVVENTFVGMAAGFGLVMGYQRVVSNAWRPILSGQLSYIVPLVLGLLLFARFNRQASYLSRWPMAFIVSVGAALSMRGAVEAEFIRQIRAAIIPLDSINSLVLILGTIGTSVYFIYTARGKAFTTVGSIGKWVMMVTFGAAFGNAVQGRISLLIGRLQFLLGTWLGII